MMYITRLMFTGAEVRRQPASPFRAYPSDYYTLMRRAAGSVPAA